MYAAYLIWIRPQVSLTAFTVEALSSCLEAAVCACILTLQFYASDVNVQTAMVILELALLLMQVLSCWVTVCVITDKIVRKLRGGDGKTEDKGEIA